MIDQTSSRIEKQETALRRQNRRRYAFQRMLEATDRVLWRLEEMNRDGVKTVPARVRAELREVVETMPNHVREPLRDGGQVQETLASLFAVPGLEGHGAGRRRNSRLQFREPGFGWLEGLRPAHDGEPQVGAVGGQEAE